MRSVLLFLLVEAMAFAAAASIHFGLAFGGYEHRKAGIAESVIAAVLIAGLASSLMRRSSTRAAGVIAQGFALLGTFVGIFTIIIGVGPRTIPDVVYHIAIVIVLILGLATARNL